MIKVRKYNAVAKWDEHGAYLNLTFDSMVQLNHFVNFVIDEKKFRWISDKKLITEAGIEVSSDDLEEAVEYEPSSREDGMWKPSIPYTSYIAKFMNKNRLTGTPPRGVEVSFKRPNGDSQSSPASTPRPKKERVPRPSKEGLITISQIAEEMKMLPREARGVLRDSDYKKPDAGWAWDPREKQSVIDWINKHKK